MTHDITQSFRETLNDTEWIDEDTRRLALHKVDSMQLRIGYPDFVLDTEALNERYADVSQIWPDQTTWEGAVNKRMNNVGLEVSSCF